MNTGHVPFFYVDPSFRLNREDSLHFLKALRGRDGDPLEVSDGVGRAWKAVARVASKRDVEAVLGEELPSEPPPSVALAAALPKGQRVSYLIEKSVEFGLSALYLLNTRFSSATNCPPGLLHRLQAIAVSAGMQARHSWLPPVHPMERLDRFLANHEGLAVLDASGTREAWGELDAGRPWTLLVGPEGGWAPEELVMFKEKRLPFLALTRHPLRMETAAVAGLAFYYALKS